MKKRMIIGAVISSLTLLSIFYACRKPEESITNPSTLKTNTHASERSAGVITYFSKNAGDTVYKMILSTDEKGIVSVDRGIYNTTRPDTFKVRIFAGEDVDFTGYTFNPDSNRYYGDTVSIIIPADRTYYVIPFEPGIVPVKRPDGGSISCHCQCGCVEPFLCCLENGPTDESLECIGICNLCYSESDGCPGTIGWSRVALIGGFVVIDANDLNVNN